MNDVEWRIKEIREELLIDKLNEGFEHETFAKEERRAALHKELESLLEQRSNE